MADTRSINVTVHRARYGQLAKALLASHDPLTAVAHELGDQAGRLDALADRVGHLEALLHARKDKPSG